MEKEKKTIDLVFKGFNFWSNPIFQWYQDGKPKQAFIGSTSKLGDGPKGTIDGQTPEEYFKENPQDLCLFGSTFDAEPLGDTLHTRFNFNFIKKAK